MFRARSYLFTPKRAAPKAATQSSAPNNRATLRLVPFAAATTTVLLAGVAPAARAVTLELLTNGDFESATQFAGWTRATDNENPALPGAGNFFIDAPGTGTPVSNSPTDTNLLTPGGGSQFAVSDAAFAPGAAGARVLYQSFLVPASTGATVTISFQWFINNIGGADAPTSGDNNGALDWRSANPTQLVRVDLLRDNPVSPFSTTTVASGGDLIRSVFTHPQRNAGGSNPWEAQAPVNVTANVVPGQRYVLRFGEVDNRQPLNFGIDNVSVTFNGTVIVPEPGTLGLLIPVLPAAVGLFLARRRRRRRI